jgi:hypothetical protein
MKNIHLLPTDKPSRLWINNLLQGKLELSKEVLIGSNTVQHIYITSDKEIKDCWAFNTHINQAYFAKGYYGKQPQAKKIILTTDQDLIADGVQSIDNEFLEWFVKNPSCEFVEINKEYLSNTGEWKEVLLPSEWEVDTKFRYKIIIPQEEPKHPKVLSENGNELFFDEQGNLIKEEPKQETLEEANWKVLGTKNDTFYNGAKWQAERMYSEKEVLELLIKSHFVEQNIEEWFEQHKKK